MGTEAIIIVPIFCATCYPIFRSYWYYIGYIYFIIPPLYSHYTYIYIYTYYAYDYHPNYYPNYIPINKYNNIFKKQYLYRMVPPVIISWFINPMNTSSLYPPVNVYIAISMGHFPIT